ncbi:NfrA family protein [Desulfovibrio desulfuricans]|nr:tetratricopeptide repeat protein [Desulfovibrio desulfuricans]
MPDSTTPLKHRRRPRTRQLLRWSIPALLALWLAPTVTPVAAADAPRQNEPAQASKGFFQDRLNLFKSYPHLDMAYRRQNQGQLEEAAKEFQQYLALRPDDAKARSDYMNLLFRMEKYAEALALLDGLPDADTNYDLQQLKASIFIKQGRSAEALDAYAKSLAAARSDAEKLTVLQSMAYLSQQGGLLEQANQYLAQARAIAPHNAPLLQKQAAIASMAGNKGEAVRLSRELTIIDPSPQNRTTLANNLFAAGQYAQAADEYAHLTDSDSQMLLKAGLSFAAAHDNANAVQYLEKYLALNEPRQTGDAMLALGNAYTELGDGTQAARTYREYLGFATEPRQKAAALLALGNAYAIAGDARKAYETYDTAQALSEEFSPAEKKQLYTSLGLSALAASSPELALKPLQTALPLQENLQNKNLVLQSLAQALTSLGNLQEAAEAWRTAAASPGVTPQGLARCNENLGYILSSLGDHAGAREAFARAVAAGGPSWELMLALAQADFMTGRFNDALEHFEKSEQLRPSPDTRLALGHTYERLGKLGLAIVNFQSVAAHIRTLPAAQQNEYYKSMGYLYSVESRYDAAVEAYGKALTLRYDDATAVRLGRAQRMSNQLDAARQTLEAVNAQSLDADMRLLRLSELATIADQEQRYPDEDALLQEALALRDTADLNFRLASLKRRTNQLPDAIRLYRKTVELEDSGSAQAALGYALSDDGQFAAAARAFEAALQKEEGLAPLYEDLGYAYMHDSQNSRAAEAFKRAIDNALAQADAVDGDKDAADKAYRLRKEVTKLQTHLTTTAYLSYAPGATGSTSWSGGDSSRTVRSGGGVELAWIPPFIGLRDDRILQVIGRVSANLDKNNSFSFDNKSWQGAVGLRYKPFQSQNLSVGVERLFHLGRNAEDNWLFRAMYSWSDGLDLQPGKDFWNYSFIYGEYDYYADYNARSALYGEVRQGVTFNLYDKWLVSPHLVGDFKLIEPDRDQDSLAEIGAGFSLRYLLPAHAYEVSRSSLEFLLQYKYGTLFHALSNNKNNNINSVFLTTIITF